MYLICLCLLFLMLAILFWGFRIMLTLFGILVILIPIVVTPLFPVIVSSVESLLVQVLLQFS